MVPHFKTEIVERAKVKKKIATVMRSLEWLRLKIKIQTEDLQLGNLRRNVKNVCKTTDALEKENI